MKLHFFPFMRESEDGSFPSVVLSFNRSSKLSAKLVQLLNEVAKEQRSLYNQCTDGLAEAKKDDLYRSILAMEVNGPR